ncbi:MAG: hypothetical protein BGO90_10265 [Legionella sp. 40-6]|nr:hypothetical protein [Legionella sp.]OJY42791.1 MAG: hypothetical protein BGO90_10265 [Legionella sp. 40-6]
MSNLAEKFRLAWSSAQLFLDFFEKIKHEELVLKKLDDRWKLTYPAERIAAFLQTNLEQSTLDKSLLNKFCTTLLIMIEKQLVSKHCPTPLGYELWIVIKDYLSPKWEEKLLATDGSKKRKRTAETESSIRKRRKVSISKDTLKNFEQRLEELQYDEEQIEVILQGKEGTVQTLLALHSQLHETLDHESITSLTKGGSTALESYLTKNKNLLSIGYTQEEIVKIGSHTGTPARYEMLEKYSTHLINLGFSKQDVVMLLCGKAYKAPELLVTHFEKLIELFSTPDNIMDKVKREGINYLRAILNSEKQDDILLIKTEPILTENKKLVRRNKSKKNSISFYASYSDESSADSLSFSDWSPSF